MEEKYFKAVSVEDELPKEESSYFVIRIKDVDLLDTSWFENGTFDDLDVTHWLKPIPAPEQVSEDAVSDMMEVATNVSKKIFKGENAFARVTKSGNYEIGYTNDYPMQHGDGERYIVPASLIKFVNGYTQAAKKKFGEADIEGILLDFLNFHYKENQFRKDTTNYKDVQKYLNKDK